MTKNPFYNSVLALLYIALVVTVLNFGSRFAENVEDNILMPIGMLSLFVLSAAMMAYIFLYQPVMMFLDGKRKEAVRLFLSTVGIFAGITAIVLIVSVVIFR